LTSALFAMVSSSNVKIKKNGKLPNQKFRVLRLNRSAWPA